MALTIYDFIIGIIYINACISSACINQGGVSLLNVNPMLIFVPCRFGYQFISILSSIFVYLFDCLPNKVYIYERMHKAYLELPDINITVHTNTAVFYC